VHGFYFAADSRLQKTKHAAASVAQRFLKCGAAGRTGRSLLRRGLHLLGLSCELSLAGSWQRLPGLAPNLFLSLGGHVELLTTKFLIRPLLGIVESKVPPPKVLRLKKVAILFGHFDHNARLMKMSET
jgi:hypothetical protein